MTQPLVLFDGVCGLCNRSVQFLIHKDKQKILRFASLQSKIARELLAACKCEVPRTDSVLFVKDGKVLAETDAVVAILQTIGYLRFPAMLLRWIPSPIRNAVYRFIARHRYRWFGKHESCPIPGPELRARFLEDS